MTTYGDLQSRIADELARSDLTAQIALEIQSAITHYSRKRFWFNEVNDASFSTVIGQEYYSASDLAAIGTLLEIDSLKLFYSSTVRIPLMPRTWEWFENTSVTTVSTGYPTDYVYYDSKIRLYPIPNVVKTLYLSYVQALPTLSLSADTNAWMTEGEELIRYRARQAIKANYLNDALALQLMAGMAEDGEGFFSPQEKIAYTSLVNSTTTRIATGRASPTSF